MVISLSAIAVIERAVFFFSMVYTRRMLGADAIGKYNWTAAVLLYFGLVINPGLETIAKREVAKNPLTGGHYVSALVTLQGMMAALAYSTIAVIACFNSRGSDISLLLWIQGIALLLLPVDLTWLVQAREKMRAVAITNVALQLLQVPTFFLLLHQPKDLIRFALIPYPFRLCLICFMGWYCTKYRLFQWKDIRLTLRGTLPLVREAMPIALSGAAVLLYYNTDAVFLGIFSGDRAVGLYTTAYRLMLVPTFIFAATMPAFFPSLARAQGDAKEAKRVSSSFFRIHAWLGLSGCAITWAAGRYILAAMYGRDFAEEGRLYEWLSLNLPLIFLNVGLLHPFPAWGLQKLHLKMTCAAAVVNVALNAVLIPRYGAPAAVVTTLLAETVVLVWGGIVRARTIHPIPWIRICLPPLVCATVTAAIIRVATVLWPHAWVAWALGGALLLLGCLCVAERQFVLGTIGKIIQSRRNRKAEPGTEEVAESLAAYPPITTQV